jgi:hypothetical protein
MLTLAAAMTSGATCQGADPAITKVVSASSDLGSVTRFTLTTTVANLGSANQPRTDLQSVDIFLNGEKNGEKGIPPLRAGQQYTFTYDVMRADGTEPGSTVVRMHLTQHGPSGPAEDCNPDNGNYRISV